MANQDAKMVRFLKSIGIENIDDFDMSFDLCARNLFDRNQIDMVIVKETPWDYVLLREFQDGLNTISYKYTLNFSYIKRPNLKDCISLFKDWYQTIYRLSSPLRMREEKGHLIFCFDNIEQLEEYRSTVNDFKDFLSFIFYDFIVESRVEPLPEELKLEIQETAESEPVSDNDEIDLTLPKEETKEEEPILEEDKELEVGVSNDEELTSETIDNDPLIEEEKEEDSNIDVHELIQKDIEAEKESAESILLEEMKKNYEQMKKDREFARRFKKGNYTPVDSIDTLDSNSGNVDIECSIFSIDSRSFNGKTRYTFGINDKNSGAIYVQIRTGQAFSNDKAASLKVGQNVRVRGCVYLDDFSKQLIIQGHYIDLLPPTVFECDTAPVKRVELHLHSQMSQMDAPGTMEEYCSYAKAMGMSAIAITDHGVVSGFPDAQKAALSKGLKVLYGCEFYMVDDDLKYIYNPADIPLNKATYVVFDLETTGLSCRYNRIIEFGAVKIEHGIETGRLDILIDPETPIPDKISKLTHITNDMVKGQPTFHQAKEKILDFIKDSILVSHNADFDVPFLNESLIRDGDEPINNPVIDTLALSRYLFPNSRNHRLGTLCRNMEVNYDSETAHRADYDAYVLNNVWQIMIVRLTENNHNLTHADLQNLKAAPEVLDHMHPYHMIAFAKNHEGLSDLYRLVSKSHIEYLSDVPKIPRRELVALHKNLIFSSACFNGDIFEIASHKNVASLKRAMDFYDYIEIQPLANYIYLVNKGDFQSLDEVKTILLDIVKVADECGKMVCATGDVHYCLKEQKIYRDVYISAKGLGGVRHPLNLNPYDKEDVPNYDSPDQYFRNTDEMLAEMAFLGEEKAYEVTVTNTNKVADMIEYMIPLPNDHLYTPKIDNCENMLRDMCYKKAHELYGDPLPEAIKNRLDTELDGIISNGYSVIYYIAHRLVKKANEDGFLVGSRGSVGSSFVATMSDITEVNPLAPHYRCPKCKHFEFAHDEFPDIKSGYDLPKKKCPVCGEEMISDGQDIPFQTFLGFHAEKTPDIDLNFPGDYQARAHDYTKVLLGEQNVFRAGTIETVAEKTAFGYVRGYFERLGINPDSVSRAKIAYIASHCIGVRRTTGQHPGGIVVIPSDNEVYDFTPIQYPANDKTSTWKTTHFDFHSIHDTILKLDLLGHVDPVALKMMADLTGIDIKTIPMNDPKVLSLFSSPKALGMKHNYLEQKTGAMAIPEFGTDFVRGMLESTKPQSFSDLVIISGLSHGTDVWNGNAEKLIEDKITDLRGVIGCRDDIMTYLIGKGVDPAMSFKIMEDVRKGRGVKPEYETAMLNNNVPRYYIDSCNKIKYMFPKGHATAYVMMAVRVGYFKVYYPLEFYATYFSARCDQWDIKAMLKGEEGVKARLEELKEKAKNEKLSPKEVEINKMLQVGLEMLQRGYKFENIDLYKSKASQFVVDHENKGLIAPFIVIDGLGANAGESIVEAREEREFTSKEDLLRRTKLTSTNVNDLSELHVLDDLNETDQLSLFDF